MELLAIGLIFGFLFVGVANSSNQKQLIRKELTYWTNRSDGELVSKWGIPDKQMEGANGQKIYEYQNCNAVGFGIPNTTLIIAKPVCNKWTFLIKDGVVVSNSYRRANGAAVESVPSSTAKVTPTPTPTASPKKKRIPREYD